MAPLLPGITEFPQSVDSIVQANILLLIRFLHLHGAYLEGQAKEIDKAFRVVVVVQITGGEGGNALVIQGVRRCGSGLDNIAFVKLEFHFARDIFLGLFNESLLGLPQRSEPFAFVYQAGETAAHLFFRA